MILYDVAPQPLPLAFRVRARLDGRQVGYFSVYSPQSKAGLHRAWFGAADIEAMYRAVKPSRPLQRFVECEVNAQIRNAGVGIELYALAIEEAARRGGYLAATACIAGMGTGTDATRVWESRRLAKRVMVFGLVAYGG